MDICEQSWVGGGEGYHMAWIKWIDWNAFSEALGHLKFYICRLGGRLAWRRTGERVGGRGIPHGLLLSALSRRLVLTGVDRWRRRFDL